MTSEIRIGIIGYGGIGKLHSRALRNLRGIRLVAVADLNAAILEELDPSIQRFSNHHELIQADVDAVIVCSPTALHFATVLDALSGGKHVLVEKPMAATAEQAHVMCDLARKTGRTLMVGMTHRFYPEFREAKRLVEEGTIGDILMCNDSIIEPVGFKGLPAWYLDEKLAGGGVAMSDGIHLVDRIRWITGAEVRQVTGSVDNQYFGGSVEDSAHMLLWLTGGVTAQISMAFMKADHPLLCDLQVVGTKGSIVVRTWQGFTLHGTTGSREKTIYLNESHEHKVQVGLEAEIEEFAGAVRENRAPSPSPEDSLRSLEIVQAFYVAAEKGTLVSLQQKEGPHGI